MPTAPDRVLSIISPSAPAAPSVVLAKPSASAPSGPSIVMAKPAPSPTTPIAVLSRPSTAPTVHLSGSITPSVSGDMIPGLLPAAAYPLAQSYSTDGAATPPSSGAWLLFYPYMLVSPAAATLLEIAPHAGYTAAATQSAASEIQILNGSEWTIYWLYSGSPVRWVDAAGNLDSKDAVTIPSGCFLYPKRRPAGAGFIGGLGYAWQYASDASFYWTLSAYTGVTRTAWWKGIGQLPPATLTWTPMTGATGTPVLTFSSLPPIPPPAIIL